MAEYSLNKKICLYLITSFSFASAIINLKNKLITTLTLTRSMDHIAMQ